MKVALIECATCHQVVEQPHLVSGTASRVGEQCSERAAATPFPAPGRLDEAATFSLIGSRNPGR